MPTEYRPQYLKRGDSAMRAVMRLETAEYKHTLRWRRCTTTQEDVCCVVDEAKLTGVMLKRPEGGLSALNIEGAEFKHSRSEESDRASLLTCAGRVYAMQRFFKLS